MQLQVTVSNSTEAADAIEAIRRVFLPGASPLVMGDSPLLAVRSVPLSDAVKEWQAAATSALAKECQTIAAELEASDIHSDTGTFTAAELANDAEPVDQVTVTYGDGTQTTAVLDPATIGFGRAVPPPPSQTANLVEVRSATGETLASYPDATQRAAPPSAGTSAVEVDSKGLPYDPRIHASTRAKIKDGSWKIKRGVEESYVATVEAELRSIMAIKAPAAPAYPVGPNTTQVLGHTVTTNFPPPPGAAPAPPPPPADDTPATFAELMHRIGPHLTDGTLTRADVAAACVKYQLVDSNGIGSIALLQQRPDLIASVFGEIRPRLVRV